jgi:hypothetical protein
MFSKSEKQKIADAVEKVWIPKRRNGGLMDGRKLG